MQIKRCSIRSLAKRTLLLLAVCIAVSSLAACNGNHSGETTASGGATTAAPAQTGTGNTPGAARRVADQAKQDTTP